MIQTIPDNVIAAIVRLREAYDLAERANRAEASDEAGGGNIPKDFYDNPHQFDDDQETVVCWTFNIPV